MYRDDINFVAFVNLSCLSSGFFQDDPLSNRDEMLRFYDRFLSIRRVGVPVLLYCSCVMEE